MDKKKLIDILKDKIRQKKPKAGKDLDEVFREWWEDLDENERYEIIKELSEGTPLEKIIAKCGCSGSSQRCPVVA